MSELTDVLTGRLNLKRMTADLLDGVSVSDSMNVDRQPPKACRLVVDIEGATISTGLVNVAGSTTETFSFSENGPKIGIKDFTSISGVTISGISGGTIGIKAVTRTGQPINQETTVYSNMAVRFYAISGKIRMIAAGQEKAAKYKFMAAPDKVIKENDIFYAVSGVQGLTMGRVDFVEEVIDLDGVTHHIEAEVLGL